MGFFWDFLGFFAKKYTQNIPKNPQGAIYLDLPYTHGVDDVIRTRIVSVNVHAGLLVRAHAFVTTQV